MVIWYNNIIEMWYLNAKQYLQSFLNVWTSYVFCGAVSPFHFLQFLCFLHFYYHVSFLKAIRFHDHLFWQQLPKNNYCRIFIYVWCKVMYFNKFVIRSRKFAIFPREISDNLLLYSKLSQRLLLDVELNIFCFRALVLLKAF